MRPLLLRVYLEGYAGRLPPRWIRRVLARTALHRAWLLGYMAVTIESGRNTSVLGRDWYRYRKLKDGKQLEFV